MNVAEKLSGQVRCPETQQALEPLDAERLALLNDSIRDDDVVSDGGDPVERTLDAALIREDGAYVYPIRDGVPNLLVSDRIPMDEG